jgi:hypothetical protein
VANACTGVNCDDANACTVDSCDPFVGACIYTEREEFFPTCDAGAGSPGVCFSTVCKAIGSDPCIEPGVGRINCCNNGGCFGPVAACPTNNFLPSGTSCDPTGLEAPGQAGQAGTCSINGECVYNTGNCADVECQDNTTECVKEWCDPDTGSCRAAPVAGAPGCGNAGACIGGFCKSQNECVNVGSGFSNCCLGCTVGFIECGLPNVFCDPTGRLNPSDTDSTLGGVCSLDSDCIPVACAVPDPDNPPGYFVEANCDDGLPCTVDTCDPSAGTGELGTGACVNTPLPDYTPCDGGQGICISGAYGANSWCVLIP